MLSSSEVSQMMASQQAMFASQRNYADNIGISPQWTGVGGMGFRMPESQRPMPGAFSYGPNGGLTGAGYGQGNRFAATAFGAAGAVAAVAPIAMGLATMAKPLQWAAPIIDPITAFANPLLAGKGIGAALSAASVPLALGAAVGTGVHSFIHGGQSQMAVNQAMGQYQFFNPMSRTGMGFSRDDAKVVGDQIRHLSHLPEMMASVEELTRVMGKLKGTGVMTGVKDVQEFSRRFKESLSTIKDVARVMGTTLEEAENFFAQSRNVGMFGRTDQVKNALNVQFTSGITGMNTGMVMGLQMAGANVATQLGGHRASGARAASALATDIGLGLRNGSLKESLIADITGATGEEGIALAAQRMQQVMVNLTGTGFGKAILAGATKFDSSGKAVGLDQDILHRLNTGMMTIDELKARGSHLTNEQKISFTARYGSLATDFSGQVDPGAAGRLLQRAAGGGSEKLNLLLQRLGGMNANEADLAAGLFQGSGTDMESMAMFKIRETGIRENYSPDAIWKRVKTKIHSQLFGGLEQAGANIFTKMGKEYDKFVDELVGRHVMTLSKDGAKALENALSGQGSKGLHEIFQAMTVGPRPDFNVSGRNSAAGAIGGVLGGIGGFIVGGGIGSILTTGAGAAAGYEYGARFGEDITALFRRGSRDSGYTGMGLHRLGASYMNVDPGTDFSGNINKLTSLSAQFRNNPSALGASGLDVEKASKFVESVASRISGFSEMDDARKMLAFDEALQDRVFALSGTAGPLDRLAGLASTSYEKDIVEESLMGMASGTNKTAAASAMLNYPGMYEASKLVKLLRDRGQTEDAATLLLTGAGKIGNEYMSQISLGGAFSDVDFKSLLSAEGRTNLLARTRSSMEDAGFSSETISFLESNQKAANVVRKMNADDFKEVFDRRNLTDEERADAISRRTGITISASDIQSVKKAYGEMDSIRRKGKFSPEQYLDGFLYASKGKDAEVVRNSMKEDIGALNRAAEADGLDDITKGLIGDSAVMLEGLLDDGLSQADLEARSKQVTKSLTSVSTRVAGLSGTARERAIKALGKFGGLAAQQSFIGDTLKGLKNKSVTGAELAKQLGFNYDDIEGILSGVSGDFALDKAHKLTGAEITRLQENLGGKLIAGKIAPAGTQDSGDSTRRLIESLNKIDGNQSQITSILAAMQDGKAMSPELVKKYQVAMRGAATNDEVDKADRK